MKIRKIKNPLHKRILRELRADWRKYLIVALFLSLTIGFVLGIYVANESMMTSSESGVTEYKLESGHFELENKADNALLADDFETVPVTIYENFFRNEEEDNNNDGTVDGTVRIYAKNDNINLACVLDGRLPETENEIAVDRMHADNVGVKTGDTITIGGRKWNVVGLIAYVNYATLHEKNTDLIFDAINFDVAMVTTEGFDALTQPVHYSYAWHYKSMPLDEKQEKAMSDDFLKVLLTRTAASGNEISDYLPEYANQAIHFATDDMGSDKAMFAVLLNILIVIIAFISAAIGNVFGYSVFKNVVVSMYYNSYSLPSYKTIWNVNAFIKTTLIPVALMFIVNLVVLAVKLKHTPLEFLRQDLRRGGRKKVVRLPNLKFFSRFRIRIIFQNLPNYLILFLGICFVSVLLAMAIGLPETLNYYKENVSDMMFANYQYVLKSSVDWQGHKIVTANINAEPFAMESLQRKSENFDEEVVVYGIIKDSKYVEIDDMDKLKEDEVYISDSFAEKYNIAVGDTIILDARYENKKYEFKVAGRYSKTLNISVFMPIEHLRETFALDDNEFTGYFSNTQLDDIKSDNISTVITEHDITKMAAQLDHSMGSYMQYMQVLCILLSVGLIYLLTKLIIEKNENAISMTKILGYENSEIARLYLLATTMVFIIFDVICIFFGAFVMSYVWKVMMLGFSGWYNFTMGAWEYTKMFVFMLIAYLIVLIFDFRRIKKIPTAEALKNAE